MTLKLEEDKVKIFKFDHSEGAEILVANNAKEAIMYYFNGYQDDINTDAICENEGIKIEELQGEAINEKHEIFNEEQGDTESVSYKEIAKEIFNGEPVVILTPNY